MAGVDFTKSYKSATGDAQLEVEVPVTWRKVVYENHNTENAVQKITFKKGIRNSRSDTRTLSATHNVGAVVKTGDPFEIAKLELSYSFSHTQSHVSMTGNEIYEERSIEHTITIPPKSKLTRWEAAADVAGTQIDYNHYIDVLNDNYTLPRTNMSRATLLVRRRIHYGDTKVRIKHLERQEYMIVVERKNWPAATLGHSSRFHFILYEDSLGIGIKTLNTMHSGYEWAYSSNAGGIYFDLDRNRGNRDDNAKQYWSISKDQPIYDGDIVTFRNKHFDDSGLCYHQGETTNVYCLQTREDKWVLEVVE